jgi:signal transduction histidine kinase
MTSRLLLVEDNPVEARELTFLLNEAGFSDVKISGSAEAGMEALLDSHFDLILTDINLPGENGFELCRQVRHHATLCTLPIVLLTNLSDPLSIFRGIEAGADGFISKGQSRQNILARLTRVLAHRSSQCEAYPATPDRVTFLQNAFELKATRRQLLEMLISGFEDVIFINEKYEREALALAQAQKSLSDLYADLKHNEEQLKVLNASLERRVTERTEELQNYAGQLEEKNAKLDQFVYVASHDLQEPVRSLVSFSRLLEADLSAELTDTARTDLHFIIHSARRMQQLVQDLLAYCQADRTVLKRRFIDLEDCVNQALVALSAHLAECNAEITRDPLPVVTGDFLTISQVYQQLINNALKFAGDEPPRIALTAEQSPDEGWIMGVRDNGIGIEQQYFEQIFIPFQRLHGRDQYDGTGIGLAICQSTIERHGGRIWVESTPGVGSHFKFTLP